MRCAVKTVATYSLFRIEAVGQGIAPGVRGNGVVESGIEHGNLGNVRRMLQGNLDAHDVGRIVQWRERDHLSNLFHYRCIDQRGLAEGFTAVHDAVPDGRQFRQRGERSGFT